MCVALTCINTCMHACVECVYLHSIAICLYSVTILSKRIPQKMTLSDQSTFECSSALAECRYPGRIRTKATYSESKQFPLCSACRKHWNPGDFGQSKSRTHTYIGIGQWHDYMLNLIYIIYGFNCLHVCNVSSSNCMNLRVSLAGQLHYLGSPVASGWAWSS